MTIINNDNLKQDFCMREAAQWEAEHGRRISRIEFVDNGDGTCTERVWPVPAKFHRIRRITGYLVGDLNRFNNAKLQEVHDRLPHNT